MKRLLSKSILVVLALASLFAASRINPQLVDMRRETGMTRADPVEDTPPMVAFTTVALGGFRGIIADWLWLRSSRLQEEGRFFELVQLAGWITELEPRFTEVWAFHGWNMAYNVSVLFRDPEDRWRWVRHGIELLRDKGLRYNPGDARLYRELGWIFQHKLGAFLDEAHWHYKREWALEMEDLLGWPDTDLQTLARAPANRSAWRQQPGADQLAARLRELGYSPFDSELLQPDRLSEQTAALLREHEAAPALLAFLRAERMRNEYRLDPERMLEIESRRGPMDWRLPEAHAIYWAERSLEYATGFDQLAAERMIFQCMAESLRRGRLIFDSREEIFVTMPNLDLLPWVRNAYEEALDEHPDEPSLRDAYINFLHEAILLCASYHQMDRARELFDILRRRYPQAAAAEDLEGFIYTAMTVMLEDVNPRSILALVEGSLVQSYFWFGLDQPERGSGFQRMAQLLYRRYQEEYDAEGQRERMRIPPIAEIRDRARRQAQQLLRRPEQAVPAIPGAETPGPLE